MPTESNEDYVRAIVDSYMEVAGPELQALLPDLLFVVHDFWLDPSRPELAADINQRLRTTLDKIQNVVSAAQERKNLVDVDVDPKIKRARLINENRGRLNRFLSQFFGFPKEDISATSPIVHLLHHSMLLKQEDFLTELAFFFDCDGILDTWENGETLTVDKLLDKVVDRLMLDEDGKIDEQTN